MWVFYARFGLFSVMLTRMFIKLALFVIVTKEKDIEIKKIWNISCLFVYVLVGVTIIYR